MRMSEKDEKLVITEAKTPQTSLHLCLRTVHLCCYVFPTSSVLTKTAETWSGLHWIKTSLNALLRSNVYRWEWKHRILMDYVTTWNAIFVMCDVELSNKMAFYQIDATRPHEHFTGVFKSSVRSFLLEQSNLGRTVRKIEYRVQIMDLERSKSYVSKDKINATYMFRLFRRYDSRPQAPCASWRAPPVEGSLALRWVARNLSRSQCHTPLS